MVQKKTAGHWGPWGIYEPPEASFDLETWEQYLKELRDVEFARGAVPTKQDMIRHARKVIKRLKAMKAARKKKQHDSVPWA